MNLVRLLVFGFIGLSILYVVISFYSRSIRREKLEDEWAETHPNDDDSSDRKTFIHDGMIEYQSGLRPKLIALVYVVPVLFVVIVLAINTWS